MAELLEKAFSEVARLPEEQQEAFVQWILDELQDEQRWDRAFAGSLDQLEEFGAQALAERHSRTTDQNDDIGMKRWIWLIVALVLGLLYSLVQVIAPDFPYFYNRHILYPLPLIASNGIFNLVTTGLIILTLTFGLLRAEAKGIWLTIAIGMSVFVTCSLPIFFCGLLTPSFSHIDTIRYESTTYRLSLSQGPEPAFDYTLDVYIVYKCDRLGLLCTKLSTPYQESSVSGEIPQHDARFVINERDNNLYVQVDKDLYRVLVDDPP